jgi:hypothetical protein
MADQDADRVVFDPALLGRAENLLRGRPKQEAVGAANSLKIDAGAFGQVPGGAEAGGRLESFATRVRTELFAVSTDLADLAEGTGQARQLATDVNGQTQAIASRGTPGGVPAGAQSGGSGGR